MKTLDKVSLSIDDLIMKINEYCKSRNNVLQVNSNGDKYIFKVLNVGFPGYLEVYNKKSGLMVDGTKGKNKDLNLELLNFVYEIVHGMEACEERVTFKNLNESVHNVISLKIIKYVDENSDLSLYEKAKDIYIEKIITDKKSKEKVTLNYYTNGTLYIFGYSIYLFDEISNIITSSLNSEHTVIENTLDEYVHLSNEKYLTLDKLECNTCDNNCDGDCSKYLYRLHFGEKIDYSCKRVSYFYVPKYIYRYATEVYKILKQNEITLMSYSELNVLSIGCGPATELIGVKEIADEIQKRINFIGIDHNLQWRYLHEALKEIHKSFINMNFYYHDLFKFVEQINPRKNKLSSNIIIFQYVISDMLKYYNHEQLIEELSKFKADVLNFCPIDCIIIFNDINTKNVTDLFNRIELLWDDKFTSQKYYFYDYTRPLYPYGERISDSQVNYSIPSYIEKRYNPWNNCRSAAILLRKVL